MAPENPEHEHPELATEPGAAWLSKQAALFEAQWQGGARPSLETFLSTFPEEARERLFGELLRIDWTYRRQAGESLNRQDYIASFPQYEAWVHRVVKNIEDEPTVVHGGSDTQRLDSGELILGTGEMIGDYRLMEELGRGGMGVIFRALQESTQRQVALKLILAKHGDNPEIAARFAREARAAASLMHPNIVPLFDAGEHLGHHYYTMQLIDGDSLAVRLRQGPLEGREAARLMLQVARAGQHAHEHQILHRDIKPHNVLLDASDNAMVVDFGLAKSLDNDLTLTETHQAIGSPPYMSPEQVRDSGRVSALTDVYSIGATLYHALTGRPPIQGPNPAETMRQVLDTDPIAPRRLVHSIDRDLETICQKCLEKEPSRRYLSAADLADDLNRYLEHQPIRARRVGVVGKTARWCRRHPAIAGLLTTVCLTLLIGSAAVFWQWRRAEANRVEAEENFALSQRAVNDLFIEVSENDLLNEPGMQPVRRKLLERALEYYQIFISRQQRNEQARRDLAQAHYFMGLINDEIGTPEASLRYLEQAIQMAEGDSGDVERLELAALAHRKRAELLLRLVRTDESEKAVLASLDIWNGLIEQHPQEVRFLVEKVRTHEQAQELYGSVSRLSEQDQQWKEVLEQTVVLLENVNGPYRTEILDLTARLALEFEKNTDRAVEIRQTLARENPQSHSRRHDLAKAFHSKGLKLRSQRDHAGAVKALEQARDILAELVPQNPLVVSYRHSFARTCDQLAFTLSLIGETDRAMEYYEQARLMLEAMRDDGTADMTAQNFLAMVYNGIALIHRDRAEFDTSVEWFEKAIETQSAMIRANPDIVRFVQDLAGTYHNMGRTNQRAGRTEDAARSYRQALQSRGELAITDPRVGQQQVDTYAALADSYFLVQQTDNYLAVLQELQAFCRGWIERRPDETRFRVALGQSRNDEVVVYLQSGQFEKVVTILEPTLEMLEGAKSRSGNWLLQTGLTRSALGQARAALKQDEQAVDDLGTATALLQAYLDAGNLQAAAAVKQQLVGIQGLRAGLLNQLDRDQEALEIWEELSQVSNNPVMIVGLATSLIKVGRLDEGIERIQPLAAAPPPLSVLIASVYALASEACRDDAERQTMYRARALEMLEAADAADQLDLRELEIPAWDPFRDKPRFKKLFKGTVASGEPSD